MSLQGNEYQQIFSYLRSLNFHFLDSWVVECVNYYKSSNPNISLDVLKNEVKQQWLLVNLREIKVPSLPPALKWKEKVILKGKYAVQVESMIDSSVSCYSQFQKLLQIDTSDAELTTEPQERNPEAKRCLIFAICDGVQEIQAMEYQPIKKIKANDAQLLPGFKMVIMGPVECRKGMILLKEENVRVCGGEVDTLTITNSLKNLLIRKLDLDETEYSETSDLAEEKTENSQVAMVPTENQLDDEFVVSLLSQNEDVFLNLPLEPETSDKNLQSNESSNSTQNVLNDSESISPWNKEGSNSKKHSLSHEDLQMPSLKKPSLDPELESNKASTSGLQNPFFNDLISDIFMSDHKEPPAKTLGTKKSVQTKLSYFLKNDNSSAYQTIHKKPVCISNKPFVYLKHIMSVKVSKPTVFIIKAIITTLKKKIAIENDEFSLKANVTDSSASIDVDFCSEILEEILGYSPCEMTEMLKVRQTNTAIAQRMKDSFTKGQEKLISLNCLMELKFFHDGRSPVVLSLEEVTKEHLEALKIRSLRNK